MSKVFGFLALIFGIFGLVSFCFIMHPFSPLYSLELWDFIIYVIIIGGFASPIVAVICGVIGLKKDDSPFLARAGFALGMIIAPIIISIFFIYTISLIANFLTF